MHTVPATLTFTFLSYPIVRVSYPIVYHVKVNVAGTVCVKFYCELTFLSGVGNKG